MSTENEQTIQVYENFGDKYLERNKNALADNPRAKKDDERHKKQLEQFLNGLPKDAKIFEVGSAGGRDAKYIQSLGYTNLTVSDVADYFIDQLKQAGLSPQKFNLITDDFAENYDFILCWAVLVHFTKDEAKAAIEKMYRALNNGGRIALCVKHKENHEEEWTDFQGLMGAKRYFSYWNQDEIADFLRATGFKNVSVEQYGGARACWLDCYAEK